MSDGRRDNIPQEREELGSIALTLFLLPITVLDFHASAAEVSYGLDFTIEDLSCLAVCFKTSIHSLL